MSLKSSRNLDRPGKNRKGVGTEGTGAAQAAGGARCGRGEFGHGLIGGGGPAGQPLVPKLTEGMAALRVALGVAP
jgi:hypothetical protein